VARNGREPTSGGDRDLLFLIFYICRAHVKDTQKGTEERHSELTNENKWLWIMVTNFKGEENEKSGVKCFLNAIWIMIIRL